MADSTSSDAALMAALKAGRQEAMAVLVDRWQRRLLYFVYRYVQNEAAARDLAEETFVRLYQARDRFDPQRSFSTWLFGIAANLCRNHQRWRTRRREAPLEALPEPVDPRHPAALAAAAESSLAVAAAVHALPHDLRLAVLLYYYEDMDYQAIAEVAGCGVRGVESRLYRARKRLAARLRGESPTVAARSACSIPT